MIDPSDPLARYLAEIEALSGAPWPERARLLADAREGDRAAKKSLIESFLFDVARIAMAHPSLVWMHDADKGQEANVILFRVIEDADVIDIMDVLKREIPRVLDDIADRGGPEGSFSK